MRHQVSNASHQRAVLSLFRKKPQCIYFIAVLFLLKCLLWVGFFFLQIITEKRLLIKKPSKGCSFPVSEGRLFGRKDCPGPEALRQLPAEDRHREDQQNFQLQRLFLTDRCPFFSRTCLRR